MTSPATRQAPPWLEQSLRQAASLASAPGLPDEAVLCVRRLAARLDTRALRHTSGLLGTADKLSRQLQVLAGEARRPAREIVPENAAAVLFDNPAQMLACAARDWLDGRFSSHWWWRSLIDGGALASGAIPLWRLHDRHIPAALAELNARAEEFCRRMTVAEAEVLLGRLSETYAQPAQSATRADWLLLPELAPDDPRRQLLALGLSLTNDAVRVRQAPAASRLVPSGAPTATPDAAGPKAHRRPQPRPDNVPTNEPALKREIEIEACTDATGILKEREPLQPPGALSPPRPDNASLPPVQEAESTPIPLAEYRQDDRSAPNPDTDTGRPDPDAHAFSRASAVIRPLTAPLTPRFAHPGESIETRYGGVLYLLNVAIHLGLYSDFTQPRNPGLALSPWAFLALVGEHLAGRKLHRDTLWTLLATLSENDGDQAIASLEASPPSSLPEAMRPYLRVQEQNTPTPTDNWPAWIDQLIPPLRRRLAAALGVPSRQVGRLLCCQSARIRLGTGRLDAHFSLNDHPIAIRLAGLDRDPGWIPSAGCDIRFFYDGGMAMPLTCDRLAVDTPKAIIGRVL